MAPLRFFNCATCGHRIRYGATHCGDCKRPAPISNTYAFAIVVVAAMVLAVVLVLR